MMMSNILEFHALKSYSGVNLNRDDDGYAKSIPFGTARRTMISSQCQKYWARQYDGILSLKEITHNGSKVPLSTRSKFFFEKKIHDSLVGSGVEEEIAFAITAALVAEVLGKKDDKEESKKASKSASKDSKDPKNLLHTQVLPLSPQELEYLLKEAKEIAALAAGKPVKDAAKIVKDALTKKKASIKANLAGLLFGGGLDARMFGRMVTGDLLSRVDGAVSVKHAITVHAAQTTMDYLTAVDDLSDQGAGHIESCQLTSGIFYSYSCIDLKALEDLPPEVVQQMIKSWTTIMALSSPQAKKGSTAPFQRASFLMVRKNAGQNMTFDNAFLRPVPIRPDSGEDLLEQTYSQLGGYIRDLSMLAPTAESAEMDFRFTAQGRWQALGEPFGKDRLLELYRLSDWAAGV